MLFDYVLRNGRIAGAGADPVDIGVLDGRVAAIQPRSDMAAREASRDIALDGRLLVPGFIETHIHLDKSCISERCTCRTNTLQQVIASVAAAKRDFTEDDIYARGKRTLEKAIVQGTTRMRTHVEVDPRIGLKGFNAVAKLKRDFGWAIDLELCVFPQEGLLNDPGCDELLVEACENGAGSIGGVPYIDSDPNGQIARIFELAGRYDLDIDFHLDFDLDPSWMHLDEVCRQADASGWGGRVAIGHVSKLSALDAAALKTVGMKLARSGVAVTVLPATDLYLMGRDADHLVPRGVAPAHLLLADGVTCSISTNNVLNPFTPFGDCSLVRMANLYANVAQAGQADELAACLDMVTSGPARLMNLKDYGIVVGNPADIVVLDCASASAAVAELAQPLMAMKHGRISFSRPVPEIYWPE
ncbi:amidohydrolase family protein [Tardiphaga sp.]|uniref:amidohydrolase family protein n=1 Tax=Tardiphaga sp. TaxID=1926292 RepID=UPI002615A0A2|nr:amidohydrolase family protein [Tardiphaga sp.]MDB5620262.1 amidohydrolase [Tardiphaga sp.]